MRKIGILTGGGDCPGLNAVIRGVVEECAQAGIEVYGFSAGWRGALTGEGRWLTLKDVEGLQTKGGTILESSRTNVMKEENGPERVRKTLESLGLEGMVAIGGDDTLGVANKLTKMGMKMIGVPKTIDNDVGDTKFKLIDHTPGYGSAARYWAYLMQNVNEENRGMCVSEPVSVLQAMGRKSGFIPAAARLADPQREMPLQLYFAESGHTLESLAENVNRQLQQSGRCIVVASEGFDVGSLGEARDGFGHIEYGASQNTVAQVIVNYLNAVGLKARGQATGQIPGVLQRSVSVFASCVDIDEAYLVGQHAVEVAFEHGTGWMATILRRPGETYQALFSHVPLEMVANSARHLPARWISPDRLDVTDDFIRYARPLIGDSWPDIAMEHGVQRFARLAVRFIDKRLPAYLPIRFR